MTPTIAAIITHSVPHSFTPFFPPCKLRRLALLDQQFLLPARQRLEAIAPLRFLLRRLTCRPLRLPLFALLVLWGEEEGREKGREWQRLEIFTCAPSAA